jgi:hypothetical protein
LRTKAENQTFIQFYCQLLKYCWKFSVKFYNSHLQSWSPHVTLPLIKSTHHSPRGILWNHNIAENEHHKPEKLCRDSQDARIF